MRERAAGVVSLLALHALAREVDAALGVLLHTTLDVPGLVRHVPDLLDREAVLQRIGVWVLSGAGLWLAAAALARRGQAYPTALARTSRALLPLLLRPAITALALVSVTLQPTFPHGFTMPVALTQDWGPAQDAAASAAVVAALWPGSAAGGPARALRLPVPGTGAMFFMAFLTYALLSPPWARWWDGHPGNEPKTLRMAVALGHGLTLDVEGVTGPMEALGPRPFFAAAAGAVRRAAAASAAMVRASLSGPSALGSVAIRATRVARQTVAGKDGGVYHVLAPGPSMLLAPSLRIDRALNRRSGSTGRLAVTLLFWNALAAALVAATFVLLRDATGNAGTAALLAGGLAVTPPFLFYFYQFYPEMLGALVLAIVLRAVLFHPWTPPSAALASALLAVLPWLHQKFLPVWVVLVVMAVLKAVHELTTLRTLTVLAVPQAATLFLFAAYNFAITGSARPDALFLAWGPGGVTSERVGDGVLGLLLDARYGILPYAPVYLLGLAGLVAPGRRAARLRLAVPAAAAYYVTVAAADNWSGAVCSLGRYFMPVAPLLAAFAAVLLARVGGRRGGLTIALVLGAWTGLFALPLWLDPHAANDCALLLSRSTFADGHVYVPDLFFRSPRFEAAGHGARVLAWAGLVAGSAWWWRRAAQGRGGTSPAASLASLAALLLGTGLVLERWPTSYGTPRFANAMELRPGVTVFVTSPAAAVGDAVRVGRGAVELLVRARPDLPTLDLVLGGGAAVTLPGRRAVRLPAAGGSLTVPLEEVAALTGRQGLRETLRRARVEVDGEVLLRLPADAAVRLPADSLQNTRNLGG